MLHFAQIVRRITEILTLTSALDAAHEACRADAVQWQGLPDDGGQLVIIDDSEPDIVSDDDDEAMGINE